MEPQPVCTLVAEDVSIRRGGETLIAGLTVDLGPGRVTWVTGPNGVGKSSLMRVLAGIEAADEGSVRRMVGGMDRSADRGMITYYGTSMGLPPEALAASFVELSARLVERTIPLAPDRAVRAKRCRSLSTGEEKRLLLGPALVSGRPFVFLDEPYEHLSRDARIELTARIVAVAQDAVVVVATNQPIPDDAGERTMITLSIMEAPIVA